MRPVKWFMPLLLVFALGAAALGIAACTKADDSGQDVAQAVIVEKRVPREILQLPDHPAGCEIVALQSALSTFGIDLDFEQTFSMFDHSDTDFVNAWWGDPDTEGAAYPQAVTKAAKRALMGTEYQAENITGYGFQSIIDAIEARGVVIAWYTTDGQAPRWTTWAVDHWAMYENEHALVVYDVDDQDVLCMDPLRGKRKIPLDEFQSIFEACGSMAVAIH